VKQLDFERAATLHKKSKSWTMPCAGPPETASTHQDLNAVILQRSAEDQSIAFTPFAAAGWPSPLSFASPKSPGSTFRGTHFSRIPGTCRPQPARLYLG